MKKLAIYTCAGFPKKDSLLEILPALSETGVEYIEVGIPYSDPVADGPTLQQVHQKALQNGININEIFKQLASINIKSKLLIMCYFNSFLQFGPERFLEACKKSKVISLIIPDLPHSFFQEHYQSLFDSYGIGMVFLIAPNSSLTETKAHNLASTPFTYALSSSSTTGSKKIKANNGYSIYLLKDLPNPVFMGFNISTKDDVQYALSKADGAIIGSAFAKNIAQANDLKTATKNFIKSLQS